jgi:hypothetical protein
MRNATRKLVHFATLLVLVLNSCEMYEKVDFELQSSRTIGGNWIMTSVSGDGWIQAFGGDKIADMRMRDPVALGENYLRINIFDNDFAYKFYYRWVEEYTNNTILSNRPRIVQSNGQVIFGTYLYSQEETELKLEGLKNNTFNCEIELLDPSNLDLIITYSENSNSFPLGYSVVVHRTIKARFTRDLGN